MYQAWLDMLVDESGVTESIAALQFFIDACLPQLHGALLDSGAARFAVSSLLSRRQFTRSG